MKRWVQTACAGLVIAIGSAGFELSAVAQDGAETAEAADETESGPASGPSSVPASGPASGPKAAPKALPAVNPPPPPAAEAEPADAADTPPEGDDPQLEEIVVTAQKRPENIRDVPLSVRTLDGEQASFLRASGGDIRFLSARIPSLTIESSFGRTFPRFYIRGLGNTDFDLNASQPVSMILDDVILENPTLKGFPIFDVERVEVLRGPQGTLFGRNTPAGTVKFESKKPTFDFEGYGRATYGSFDFVGLEAAVSAPVIPDILAARVSVLYERRDDWVDNLFTEEEDTLEGFEEVAGRFQLLFTPSDKLRVLFNMHGHSLEGTARLFRANIIQPGTDEFVDGFDRGQISHDGQNFQTVNQLGLMANIQYDVGTMLFTSISGYESIEVLTRGDIDGGFGASFAPPFGPGFIPFPSETADGIPRLRQFTQEFRLATNDWKPFNFQLGVFYFHEDLEIDSFSYNTLAGGGQDGRAFQMQTTDAFALFASGSLDLTDNLRIAGGVRFSDDQKDFSAERSQSPIGGGELAPITANPNDTFVSWDGSVTWGLNDDVNLYARVARGFRAPSIQGRVLFGDSISVAESEEITSFEAGLKSDLFNRRARLNVTGFYYELDNQQLTAVGGAANFNSLLNADKTEGFGFEADAQVMLLSNFALTFGLSFNNTEIQDEGLAIAPCGGGCTVLDDPGDVEGSVVIDGNPLPHAPKWIFNATARYGVQVHEAGEVFLFADLAYRSRINFFLYESEEFTDASLTELGVRIGYTRFDGRFEGAFFTRNLNDDLSRTGGIDFNNLTGFVNEPRTWGFEARFRF